MIVSKKETQVYTNKEERDNRREQYEHEVRESEKSSQRESTPTKESKPSRG